MKKILLLLLLGSSLNAQENIEFFDPNELERGMKGYALTVFQGLEPEKMDVEIVAYMPNRLTKLGMILVKLSGANVERSRVAAGMSGSPVYIDGKLVGALAYTWADARELLAGVIPIQAMVSLKERGVLTSFSSLEAIQTAWIADGFSDPTLLQTLQNIDQKDMYPRGIERFKTIPSSRTNGIAPLKAGDSVAIKLVEGDLNLASIGTVTYVDGEDVYIYGHPMDGEGPVSLPLARAEIYDIMSSTKLSFKIGRALPQTVGSTVFDGLSAVYGRFDKEALMIPVSLKVKGKDYSNSYRMNVARSQKYFPTLLGRSLEEILSRELGKNIEKQINLSWSLSFTNDVVITNEVSWVKHTFYGPESLKDYWQNYIEILWNNSLVHLVPEKIEFVLEIQDKKYDYYSVAGVKISQKSFVPGENINIQVVLEQYLENALYTNIILPIPQNIKSGTYSVVVGDQLTIDSELMARFPEYYNIRTESQLLKELGKEIDTDSLRAVLVDVHKASVIGSEYFGAIPQSRRSLFESRDNEGKNLLAPRLFETKIVMNNPVIGGRSFLIKIDVPEVSEK